MQSCSEYKSNVLLVQRVETITEQTLQDCNEDRRNVSIFVIFRMVRLFILGLLNCIAQKFIAITVSQ